MDLIITNALIPDREEPVDIGIREGVIQRIDAGISGGNKRIDADNNLVVGGFCDPHLHLDKSMLCGSVPPNTSGTLGEAIENNQGRKESYTIEGVCDRAIKAIEMHVRNGCTRMRTHVDVDSYGGLTPLKGVLEAKEATNEIADIQIIAFPQEGIIQDPGTEELLREALENGADIIGGMPDNEHIDEHRKRHIEICLDLANEYSVPVDMHVDETDTPTARSLEYLATSVIESDLSHSVVAGHTCSLASYDETHAKRVIDLVKEAGIGMITNPPANMLVQGQHDTHPKRRGITRVDELLEAGIPVAAGQDAIQNGFYPYGRGDMVEVALISAHAAHLQSPSERETAWEMVTSNAANIMEEPYGIIEDNPAIVNVFPDGITNYREALSQLTPPRYVIHNGKIVAETKVNSTLRYPV